MNNKLLLINPPFKNKYMRYFPLGLGYLANACTHADIDIECLDLNVNNLTMDQLILKLKNDKYHVVGLGGFSVQLKSTIDICNTIKTNFPDITVIVGGVQVYGSDDFILNNSKADIVCIGESELILPELIHQLYKNGDLSNIPSIKYKKNGSVIDNGGFSIVNNLDEISFPKYDAFEMEKYIKSHYNKEAGLRTIDFIFSRGCPYKCSYCINSKKPVKVRYRSVDNIITEIRLLKNKYQINDFACTDELFTINKKKALEICEALKTEGITWRTSVRADGINEELLLAMKNAGCRQLVIGLESGSDRILQSMNKKADTKKYHEAIKLLRKHDINFYPNFMIGMPEETEATIKETEKFCIDNELIFGPSYVTPFPGTKLYDNIQDDIDFKEYLTQLYDLNYVKKPIINLTSMDTKTLIYLRNRAVVNSTAAILSKRFRYIPLIFLKTGLWFYLTIFNMDNPLTSKIIYPINKIIYKFLNKGKE